MTAHAPAGYDYAVLDRALHHAREFLDGLDSRSVAATVDLDSLRARLDVELTRDGVDPVRIIDELVAGTEGGHLGSASGRFYAWVIGGGLPASLAADWLASAWDNNAGMYACAPAASVVEEIAGRWLIELTGLPAEASFALTTGCQMAHFTALAAARHAVLARAGWNVEADGLFGAPRIRVLASAERHSSVDRALRFLGIGTTAVEPLPVDAEGRVTVAALQRALDGNAQPLIVVLDAADLNIGAFDPFSALIPIAKRAGAWVHVDGAFGLFAAASASKRAMVEGMALADSWATDAHKWLNVPYDCGVAVVRDRDAHRAAMTVSASYLAPEARARDAVDWNPEFSRRARGYALYAALRELGRGGLESLVDRCCAYCHAIVTGIGALDGAELVWAPALDQGLVRFLDPRPGAGEADHDRFTDATIAAINATGEAFFSGSTWRGRRVMRVSVVNWRTNEDDVARTIAAVRGVLARGAA